MPVAARESGNVKETNGKKQREHSTYSVKHNVPFLFLPFLMELDPPYRDVIVERWQKSTGRKSELVSVAQEVTA